MNCSVEAKMTTSVEKAVEEVMRLHKSLPARPGIEEVEAARSLIQNVEREDALKLERISQPSTSVPQQVLTILQEMQRTLIHLHSKEQKKEAQKVLDLHGAHSLFDELIQRASLCLNSTASPSNNSNSTPQKPPSAVYMKAKDDSFLNKPFKASALRLDRVARPKDVPTPPRVLDSTLTPELAHAHGGYECILQHSCVTSCSDEFVIRCRRQTESDQAS